MLRYAKANSGTQHEDSKQVLLSLLVGSRASANTAYVYYIAIARLDAGILQENVVYKSWYTKRPSFESVDNGILQLGTY